MAVTPTPVIAQVPKNSKVQILPADASGLKTIWTGGANGTKITAIIATSNDTATRDVQIGITTAAVFFPLATITLAINAGQVAGTPAVNLLDPAIMKGLPIDSDGNPYLFLSGAGDTLQIKSLTTVTAAKEIDVTAIGADF